MKLKYTKNLKYDETTGFVYSYKTHVATRVRDTLYINPLWDRYSSTTSKHINYIKRTFNLNSYVCDMEDEFNSIV